MILRETAHGARETWLNSTDLPLVSIKTAVVSCDVTEGIIERLVTSDRISVVEAGGQRLISAGSLAIISESYGMQVEAVRKVLENAARRRQILSYKQLADAAGLTYQIVRDKRILSKIVETLCKQAHGKYSILLPALARRTDSLTSMPPENFFIVADRLGYKVDDDRKFLEAQTTKVWNFYCHCRFPHGFPQWL